MSEPVQGRRERKKAITRSQILEAALRLFLERGFDDVSVREIADLADVSPATVFAHFPQKEMLLFYEEDDHRERLIEAVRDRAAGITISRALLAHFRAQYRAMWSGPDATTRLAVAEMMEKTPSLREFAERMWVRHETALAEAIASELALPEATDEIKAFSRFALQIQLLASGEDDPMLDAAFRVLDDGWARYETPVTTEE